MAAAVPDDYFSLLYSHIATAGLAGLIKAFLFYLLIAACTIQTFYPVFMIIAMVIRQLGIFAHFFHKVSSLFVDCEPTFFWFAVFGIVWPTTLDNRRVRV